MFRQKAPKLVTIAIITTMTIVFWVFFSLYQVLVHPSETHVPDKLLEEINPTLDTATLSNIQNRQFFEEGQVQPLSQEEELVETVTETPTPTIEPTETAIEEEITATPTP